MKKFSLRAAAIALAIALAAPAGAQQAPSPAAVAMAKEILTLKGAAAMWEPVIPGVIARARQSVLNTNALLAQSNPGFIKDLNDIANALVTEFAAKSTELTSEVAQIYAQHFTEPELKDLVAFYKSPLGQKVITEEPKVIDESAGRISRWAEQFTETVLARLRTEMKKKGHDI
jgi:hypothetical protein